MNKSDMSSSLHSKSKHFLNNTTSENTKHINVVCMPTDASVLSLV